MADQDASWLIGSATPSFSMSFSPASQIGAVAQAPLDAPTFEALAADLEREGLPAWEAARVASTMNN